MRQNYTDQLYLGMLCWENQAVEVKENGTVLAPGASCAEALVGQPDLGGNAVSTRFGAAPMSAVMELELLGVSS